MHGELYSSAEIPYFHNIQTNFRVQVQNRGGRAGEADATEILVPYFGQVKRFLSVTAVPRDGSLRQPVEYELAFVPE